MSTFPPAPHGGLLRHLAVHLAFGVTVGIAFALALVASDVAGLRGLIGETSQPGVALFMLCFMNALTFGSLAMGAGIMSLPRDRGGPAPRS